MEIKTIKVFLNSLILKSCFSGIGFGIFLFDPGQVPPAGHQDALLFKGFVAAVYQAGFFYGVSQPGEIFNVAQHLEITEGAEWQTLFTDCKYK
jgi:hypothetical protein